MFRNFWKRLDPSADTGSHSTLETQTEAMQAKTQAAASLREARAQKPFVDYLVNELQEQIDRNHFGELIEFTMRGTG